MVAPAVLAAGIGALGSLAGGLLQPGQGGNKRIVREANSAAIAGKMEAAKKYGISPLYALGAPTISPPGVSVGSDLGSTISNMGADVSRAVGAYQTPSERNLQSLVLEKAALENEFLRSQIASINNRTLRESAPGVPGAIPEVIAPAQRTPGGNFAGVPVPLAPDTSNWGQIIEDRYGDDNPLTWPIGGAVMLRDLDNYLNTTIGSPSYWGTRAREYLFGK